jgi:hypothetical protein
LINYGASVGHIPVRLRVMHDPGGFLPTGDTAHRAGTDREIAACRRQIEQACRGSKSSPKPARGPASSPPCSIPTGRVGLRIGYHGKLREVTPGRAVHAPIR